MKVIIEFNMYKFLFFKKISIKKIKNKIVNISLYESGEKLIGAS